MSSGLCLPSQSLLWFSPGVPLCDTGLGVSSPDIFTWDSCLVVVATSESCPRPSGQARPPHLSAMAPWSSCHSTDKLQSAMCLQETVSTHTPCPPPTQWTLAPETEPIFTCCLHVVSARLVLNAQEREGRHPPGNRRATGSCALPLPILFPTSGLPILVFLVNTHSPCQARTTVSCRLSLHC
jgi:hypothetical protein